jgi:hypothetical protein
LLRAEEASMKKIASKTRKPLTVDRETVVHLNREQMEIARAGACISTGSAEVTCKPRTL